MARFFQILGGIEAIIVTKTACPRKCLSRIHACKEDGSQMTSHKRATIFCQQVWKREYWKKLDG